MSNLRSVKVGRGIGVGRAPSTQDLMIRSGSPLPRPLLFMTLASFGDLGRRMVESVNRRPCVWRTTAVRVHPRARRRGTPRVRANPSGPRGRRRDVAAEVVAMVALGRLFGTGAPADPAGDPWPGRPARRRSRARPVADGRRMRGSSDWLGGAGDV